MPTTIRLSRIGAKKKPVYRIVVTDSRAKRDGQYIDLIGLYDPVPVTPQTRIDEEKVFTWLKRGATLSDTVKSIFRKHGILRKWAAIQSGQPVPETETEPASAAPEVEEPAEPEAAEAEVEEATEASETEAAEEGPPQEAAEASEAEAAEGESPDKAEPA